MTTTGSRVRAFALLGLAVLLFGAGCAGKRPDRRALDEALYAYSSAIRWGELEAALSHVDPEVRRERPLSDLERRRFQQLQVSGYYVRGREEPEPGEVRQLVEIRVVNRHTQTERSVLDRQHWRWDPEARTWWLVSGLPEFAPGN